MFDLQSAHEAFKSAKPTRDILEKNRRYEADSKAADEIKKAIKKGDVSTVVEGPLSNEFVDYLRSPKMGYYVSEPGECEDNRYWYTISWEPRVKK